MKKKKPSWGGKRKNAGRKSEGVRVFLGVTVSEDTKNYIDATSKTFKKSRGRVVDSLVSLK